MMPVAEVDENIKCSCPDPEYQLQGPVRQLHFSLIYLISILLLVFLLSLLHLFNSSVSDFYSVSNSVSDYILLQVLILFHILFQIKFCSRLYSASGSYPVSKPLSPVPKYFYSSAGRSSAMLRSLSCTGSTTSGAPLMRSAASLFLGKAMTSRMLSAPVRSMTKRSTP